jgi:hypothetical protein
MSEFEDTIFRYPAKILSPSLRQMDLTSMMDMLKEKMHDPAMMDGKTPFFWSAEISNGQVDAYGTFMLPSTLANFAEDANAGISFMNSHRHDELPMGRSLAGRMEATAGGQRVVADFYTMPGLELNEVSTDDFISGVRSGIIRDTSVGFFGGKYFCSICKMDYRSYDCPHMAGMEYQIQGGGMVTCTVGIDNARLAEVSAVYDGATPDATILKAQRMVEAGELKPDAVRMLEARYRMSFSNKRSFAGATIPERKKKLEYEQMITQIREVLDLDATADVVSTVLSVAGERDRLCTEAEAATKEAETLRARVTELTPQAADGVAYRTDLVNEALAEGVRALGDKFNAATYEPILRGTSLAAIKQMKTDWEAVGNSRFPGGRKTVDNSEAPEASKTARKPYVPEAAYKS